MKWIFNWPNLFTRKIPNLLPIINVIIIIIPHHGLCWCNFPLKKLNTGNSVLFSFACHLSPIILLLSCYQVLLTSLEISFDLLVSACAHPECVFLGIVLAVCPPKTSLITLYVSFHLPLLLLCITSAVLLVAVVTGPHWLLHTRPSPSPRPSAFWRARPRSGACTPS